jgi:hypothetical protein
MQQENLNPTESQAVVTSPSTQWHAPILTCLSVDDAENANGPDTDGGIGSS